MGNAPASDWYYSRSTTPLSSAQLDVLLQMSQKSHKLDVTSNFVQKIPDKVWKHIEIRRLNLSLNPLQKLSSKIKLLKRLRYLDISHSLLTSLPDEICQVPLISLNIEGCKISKFPSNFGSMKQLRFLNMRATKFPARVFPPQVFQLSSLRTLYCESCPAQLDRMQLPKLAKSFPLLKHLELVHMGLDSLHYSMLKNLPNLTSLDISHNSFKSIDSRAFDHIPKLTQLICNDNFLTTFPSEVSRLQRLHRLHLKNNNLKEFPPVQGIKSLTDLQLSHNSISSIPDLSEMEGLVTLYLNDQGSNLSNVGDLSRLPSLKRLYLDHNSLDHFPKLNSTIETVDICHNKITQISFSDLSPYKNLNSLCLINNPILSIELSILEHPPQTLIRLLYLREAQLDETEYISSLLDEKEVEIAKLIPKSERSIDVLVAKAKEGSQVSSSSSQTPGLLPHDSAKDQIYFPKGFVSKEVINLGSLQSDDAGDDNISSITHVVPVSVLPEAPIANETGDGIQVAVSSPVTASVTAPVNRPVTPPGNSLAKSPPKSPAEKTPKILEAKNPQVPHWKSLMDLGLQVAEESPLSPRSERYAKFRRPNSPKRDWINSDHICSFIGYELTQVQNEQESHLIPQSKAKRSNSKPPKKSLSRRSSILSSSFVLNEENPPYVPSPILEDSNKPPPAPAHLLLSLSSAKIPVITTPSTPPTLSRTQSLKFQWVQGNSNSDTDNHSSSSDDDDVSMISSGLLAQKINQTIENTSKNPLPGDSPAVDMETTEQVGTTNPNPNPN